MTVFAKIYLSWILLIFPLLGVYINCPDKYKKQAGYGIYAWSFCSFGLLIALIWNL